MTDYEDIRELLYLPADRGVESIPETGATIIGHAPEIAPLAWLNMIFAPVTGQEVHEINERIDRKNTGLRIPEPYVEFLTRFSNGLSVFVDVLSLNGYRYNYIRQFPWSCQPFAMDTSNTYERPDNAPADAVFIGSYRYDVSHLYMEPDGKVHYCKRRDATSLRVWPSLHAMLKEELERLNRLYKDLGTNFIEEKISLPPY